MMRAPAACLGVLVAWTAHSAPRAAIAWSPSIEIATGGGEHGPWRQNDSRYDHVDDPTVALDPRGDAVVAWVDHRIKDVVVQRLDRAGRPRFTRASNVSRTPAVFSWLPRVVLAPGDPQRVFVLWQEIIFSGGSHGGDILFARSLDGGASFEPARNLSSSIGGDGKARIDTRTWHNGSLDLAVAPDGTLHAAWTEYDGPLWIAHSRDDGATFSRPVQIAGDRARPARAPALAVTANAVYLAWTTGEDAAADIRVATSRDHGATFSAPVIVERTPTYSDAPKLAIDPRGTLHLAYAESTGGPFDRFEVRYTRSRDGGRQFERTRTLSRPPPAGTESAAYPALAIDARGDIHVLWELYPDHRQPARGLGLATSTDGGTTFSAPSVVPGSVDPEGGVNGSAQGKLTRKLAASGDQIAVVDSSFVRGRSSRVWLLRGAVR